MGLSADATTGLTSPCPQGTYGKHTKWDKPSPGMPKTTKGPEIAQSLLLSDIETSHRSGLTESLPLCGT